MIRLSMLETNKNSSTEMLKKIKFCILFQKSINWNKIIKRQLKKKNPFQNNFLNYSNS